MPPKAKKKPKRPWQDVARAAQKHRDESLSKFLNINFQEVDHLPKRIIEIPDQVLSSEDSEIGRMSVGTLAFATSTGFITAHEVTLSFLRRAALAQNIAGFRF